MTDAARHAGDRPRGAATIETLAPGIHSVHDGRVGLFVGECPEGCAWTLAPNYRTLEWVAQHGENQEAVLVFDRAEPFDPNAMMTAIDDWLERCHAYEARS